MIKQRKDLKIIDVDAFYEGMHVKSGIFYNYKNTYVLLCRDIQLTQDLLQRLREISVFQHGIYIENTYYESIAQEGIRYRAWRRENDKNKAEKLVVYSNNELDTDDMEKVRSVRAEYGKITAKATYMIDEAAQTGKVPLHFAAEISETVTRMLANTDDALVIHCINEIRKMDDSLYTHSVDVAILNGLISKWMNLSSADTAMLIRIGLLHDLGKLKVPPEILHKPGRLDKKEFDVIKLHSANSYDILKNSGILDKTILLGVRGHHEKIDGSGYPDHLKMHEIPFFARISAVADIYDAMVSKRCYKQQNSPFEVLDEFSTNLFSHLDRQIVNVFLDNMPRELVGRKVRLTTGEEGVVVYVSPLKYAYPIIRVGNKLIPTNPSCKCEIIGSEYSDFLEEERETQ